MNAEEMFSELGYKKCNDCINPSYSKIGDPYTWVNFYMLSRRVAVSSQRDLGYECLGCELIKAIHKQCEELGWI